MDECKFKPGDKVVIHGVVVTTSASGKPGEFRVDTITVETKNHNYLNVWANDADNPPDIPPGSGGGGRL